MSSSKQPSTASEEAIQLVCRSNFHRCLFLPSSATHERLRVTYAVSSNFSDDALPVILFCGPMFATRYHAIGMDHLAMANLVRVIHVDRPGFGGSTRCVPAVRISVWLELVPILLEKLNVKHVSLVSHSAGTLYLLNTLWYHRKYLDPVAPYAGLITPWVHSEHSQVMLMNVVSKLPNSLINSWNSVMRFVAGDILPAAAWSGGIFTAASNVFKKAPAVEGVPLAAVGETVGVNSEERKEIENAQLKFMFMEETVGLNDEVMILMRKDGINWDACNDYPEYVARLHKRESKNSADTGTKLKIQVFFAESDIMIGKGGQKYFNGCWKQDDMREGIQFDSMELQGTDHDSAVMDEKKGALGRIFDEVRRSSAHV